MLWSTFLFSPSFSSICISTFFILYLRIYGTNSPLPLPPSYPSKKGGPAAIDPLLLAPCAEYQENLTMNYPATLGSSLWVLGPRL